MLYHHLNKGSEFIQYIFNKSNLNNLNEARLRGNEKQATEASGVLNWSLNETRLLILCSIIEDDFTVNQLSEITGTVRSWCHNT